MKLILFNINFQQREIATEWAKKNHIEIYFCDSPLNKNTVYQAEGFDGVVNSEASNKIDNEIYPVLQKFGIKQIAQSSAGFDFYDLDEAKKYGIIITNVPSYSPESIAEYTILTALNLIRKNNFIQSRVKNQNYTWHPSIQGNVMGKMKVAIIGTGRIGQITARLFHGFGCKVVGYDIYQNANIKDILIYSNSIEEAVSDADIVSLHMPATAENKYLFNYEMFQKFKTGAIILNMARGSLIDTKGLLKSLEENKLSGAGLDTYENEANIVRKDLSHQLLIDDVFQKILHHDKIIYSPHIAFFTDEAIKNLIEGALKAAVEVIYTGDSSVRVN